MQSDQEPHLRLPARLPPQPVNRARRGPHASFSCSTVTKTDPTPSENRPMPDRPRGKLPKGRLGDNSCHRRIARPTNRAVKRRKSGSAADSVFAKRNAGRVQAVGMSRTPLYPSFSAWSHSEKPPLASESPAPGYSCCPLSLLSSLSYWLPPLVFHAVYPGYCVSSAGRCFAPTRHGKVYRRIAYALKLLAPSRLCRRTRCSICNALFPTLCASTSSTGDVPDRADAWPEYITGAARTTNPAP